MIGFITLKHKLRVENIIKSYSKVKILHGVSLEVNSGEVIGLIGPNGAGKTTLFYIICGLVLFNGGKVFFDDYDISILPLHQKAKKGIGYLPQETSIFKDLSIEDNLYLAAELSIEKEKDREDKVNELLDLFNIEPIRRRKGISLSGGERRRVEIARALVSSPKFLLLDEPFAGVDPIAVADIQNIILKLKTLNIGVLITDHNVRETLSIVDRAYVIKDGLVLVSGNSKDILNDPNVKTHYLGENFKI
jgi:lipopolysaccharide export system ATP-binding protein